MLPDSDSKAATAERRRLHRPPPSPGWPPHRRRSRSTARPSTAFASSSTGSCIPTGGDVGGVDRKYRHPLHPHLTPAEQPRSCLPRERVDVAHVEHPVVPLPVLLDEVVRRAQGLA